MKVYEIYFSPTGGTKKVTDILAKGLSDDIISVDLTKYNIDFNTFEITQNDIAIISVPSYGGRVPSPAIERISKIKGNGASVVLVCVYGNRAYEDTLIELQDIVKKLDFHIIAAITAVAEHSIAHQFATGRPDTYDCKKLLDFASKISNKFYTKNTIEPKVHGKYPYKKNSGNIIIPKPNKHCTKCGLCAKECPVQAIDKNYVEKVNNNTCISCMRCVSVCPNSARKVNKLILFIIGLMLKKVCLDKKEYELFI